MTLRTLIGRSLRFHWRGQVGVVLGAAIGSAALIGALVVGDSVRQSLRDLALQRLGGIDFTMDTGDRLFRARLAEMLSATLLSGSDRASWWPTTSRPISPPNPQVTITKISSNRFIIVTNQFSLPAGAGLPGRTNIVVTISAALRLAATAGNEAGEARANQVQLLGVNPNFALLAGAAVFSNLGPDEVVLNSSLAQQLRADRGDTVIVRARKPEALGTDSPITPTENSVAVMRLRVRDVLGADALGNFSLTANQVPPFNAFVALPSLEERVGSFHQANLLLVHLPGDAYWAMPGNGWRDQFYAWVRRLTRQPMPPVLMITNTLSTKIALARLDRALDQRLDSTDVQLRVIASATTPPEIEIRSSRVFLDSVLADALFQAATNSAGVTHFPEPPPYGVLTYLANLIRHGDHATPYSMVTAAAPPLVPADLQDDEILISQWLADDLGAGPGATIELVYFQPDQASQMTEVTNRFRIKAVLRMNDPAFDRSLMPDFRGVADAEKPGEWQTGFPLQHKIREKDDEYWREYRGTPKAFITLKAGQQLWGNRFGNLTAIRFPLAAGQEQFWYLHQTQIEQGLRGLLQGTVTRNQAPGGPLFDRRALGFRWEPVRDQALAASAPTQDFGQLFLGFSFFLILAALILMALLFQFGLEQRTQEIGTLLALGFRPRRVRWLLLGEGTLVAFVGGGLGVFGGLAYAQGMIRGLTTIWRNAIGTSALQFHVTPVSVVIGLFSSVAVCALTIWIVLRKQARQPARVLLALGDLEETEIIATGASAPRGRFIRWVAIGANSIAVLMVAGALWRGEGASPQLFFGAGSLLLVGLIATVSVLLTALERSTQTRHLTLAGLGLRGCTRRRTRSLACVTLLACGSFLIVAVGANRLDADRQPTARSSGTGGFALLGESALPVVRDLNTPAGREFYGLNEADFAGVRLVPFRVRAGDDASCLNLNRAHAPRVLGVKPELLAERGAFSFAQVERGRDAAQGWNLLKRTVAVGKTALGPDEIPAIGDAASIQWALRKKLGDTIEYIDEQGRAFKLRLVAGVANSILQGSLIIDEAEFVKRFPSESGHRMFLIDVSTNQPAAAGKLEAALGRALRDVGLELTPTTRRLAAFNAVQNTYLNTFQVLGGLGLLLGSAGLGVVVLRNVLERRAEFGLLQAVGWRRRSLQWLVLSEHGGLLWLGLGAGLIAALAAILPVLLAPGAQMHTRAFAATLVGVFASGLIWTWLATLFALRGRLLDALQDE